MATAPSITPSAAAAAAAGVPAAAIAAGNTIETFGTGGLQLGTNWFNFNYYGANPALSGATQTSSTSVTISGTGGDDTYNAQIATAYAGSTPTQWTGEAFGGGGYFQVTMSFPGVPTTTNGWPSFFANTIEGMSGQIARRIEVDSVEFNLTGQANYYDSMMHDWSPDNVLASEISTARNAPIELPAGTNTSLPNTYGFLWVPATSKTQGYIKWFFNGNQVGTTDYWNQYDPALSAAQNPYALLDINHLVLIAGTGTTFPLTVSDVQVWQSSGASDLINGSAVSVTPPVTPPSVTPSANDTVVMAGSTAAITDASGNLWTITSGAQIAVNGVTDTVTAGVAELAYVNGTIWQENTQALWYSKVKPNDSWSTATTASPLPVSKTSPTPSANDTVVMAGSTAAITDASGNLWTITSGAQIAVNGVTDTVTAGVAELAYVNGTIWQENTQALWYSKVKPNDSWSTATTASPLPVSKTSPTPSANDTVVMAGSTAAITDASGNLWTITSGAQIAVNGVTDTVTAGVAELAYVNGTIWQENTQALWYSKVKPNDSWSTATTASPLPVSKTSPTPSANDTVVMAGSTAAITDASGNLWTITSGAQIAVNGVTDTVTAGVAELAYVNGTIWQENTQALWYSKVKPNDSWSTATTASPLPVSKTSPTPSANDTVVMAGSTAAITDASGNLWTITSGAQIAVNGVTDTVTAGVAELAYVNGTIWQENTQALWYSKVKPNDSWSTATTASPLPVSKTSPTPSANDTVVMAGSTAAITDASGNLWTITSGAQIAVNGVTDTVTAGVAELAYVNGTIWQENTQALWYSKVKPNDSWSTATTASPLPVSKTSPTPSANDTVVMAGSTAAITDASGNLWTITSGAQIAVNGVTDTVTAGVAELAYVNGTIWQENTQALWYSKVKPNDSWSTATTVAPLVAVITVPATEASVSVAVINATINSTSGSHAFLISGHADTSNLSGVETVTDSDGNTFNLPAAGNGSAIFNATVLTNADVFNLTSPTGKSSWTRSASTLSSYLHTVQSSTNTEPLISATATRGVTGTLLATFDNVHPRLSTILAHAVT